MAVSILIFNAIFSKILHQALPHPLLSSPACYILKPSIFLLERGSMIERGFAPLYGVLPQDNGASKRGHDPSFLSSSSFSKGRGIKGDGFKILKGVRYHRIPDYRQVARPPPLLAGHREMGYN
jgi:hypothetical protein